MYPLVFIFLNKSVFSKDSATSKIANTNSEFVSITSSEPYLICDLDLTKSGAESKTSRLNDLTLLGNVCKITAYKNRHCSFLSTWMLLKNFATAKM